MHRFKDDSGSIWVHIFVVSDQHWYILMSCQGKCRSRRGKHLISIVSAPLLVYTSTHDDAES